MSALTFASARLCAAARASKPAPATVSRAIVRPERASRPAGFRTAHTASTSTVSPGTDSKRWTSIATR